MIEIVDKNDGDKKLRRRDGRASVSRASVSRDRDRANRDGKIVSR